MPTAVAPINMSASPLPALALARSNMVINQLKPNGIRNVPLRRRFNDVPRENFCDPAAAGLCYRDSPIPQAAPNRALYAPLAEAKLLMALNLQPHETFLVLAAGSGYSAALAAGLCAHVILLEDDADLRNAASHNLVHTPGVTAQITVASANLPSLHGPLPTDLAANKVDAILLAAAADALPIGLAGLLTPAGRVAAIVPDLTGVMAACLFSPSPDAAGWANAPWSAGWQPQILLETTAPVLPIWAQKPQFVF